MIGPRNALHSAFVFKTAAQVSNEAALRVVWRAMSPLKVQLGAMLNEAHPVDDSAVPGRDVDSVLRRAGPDMAGTAVPAMDNLFAADGAVSP